MAVNRPGPDLLLSLLAPGVTSEDVDACMAYLAEEVQWLNTAMLRAEEMWTAVANITGNPSHLVTGRQAQQTAETVNTLFSDLSAAIAEEREAK